MDSYRPVILFIILICFHVGHTLRCACREDLRTCTSIHNMQTNFKTAQKICMEKGGKLLTALSKTIDSLLFNKTGHFWIVKEGDCLSSSRNSRGDSVTLNRGGEDGAGSPQCMSVSNNKTLMERSCEEQVDGFLCDGIQWENCWEERASEVQILNKKDCGLAPCEHLCEEVPGGHMCTCSFPDLFRPSRKNPEHCECYCDFTTCKSCTTCPCPDGFMKDEENCTDLNECKSNHDCEQICTNTIGSYKCSCYEGFMLVNKTKCVPFINPTLLTTELVTPSVNYTLSHAAFATPAEYIGFTLLIMLAVCVLIGLLYYLRKSKSDVLLKNYDIPDDITVQDAQLQL